MDMRDLIDKLRLLEASYDSKVAALLKKYPDSVDTITDSVAWAKKHLQKSDRIMWYLGVLDQHLSNPADTKTLAGRNFEQFHNDLFHYIGQTNIVKIQNYQFQKQPAEQVFADLQQIEREVQKKQQAEIQPAGRFDPAQNDRVLLEFPDGTRWVQLDTAYCEKEGKSGAHCGNVAGQHETDQRILSLRTPNQQVILTFILEPNGYLGERKARFNNKPAEQYHPQIMQLLLQPYIKGLSKGGYAPDQDFSVFDLSDENLSVIQNQKPQLITSEVETAPIKLLQAPDWIKKNPQYQNIVIEQMPEIKDIIENPSIDNWKKAIKQRKGLILYAPDNFPNYREKLMKYLTDIVDPNYTGGFEVDEYDEAQATLLKIRKKYSRDFNFLKELMEKRPIYFEFVSENQKGYMELAKIAVSKGGYLYYVPENLRTPELCMIAVKRDDLYALDYVPVELRTPELCMVAVKHNGRALEFVPENLRTPELCMAAVKQDSKALEFVPENLRNLFPQDSFNEDLTKIRKLAGLAIQ